MKEFRGGPRRYGEIGLSERRTRGRWLRRECSVARLSPARFWSRWSRWSSWSSSSSSCCSPVWSRWSSWGSWSCSISDQRRLQKNGWRLCGARVTLIAQGRVPSTALPMPGKARGSPTLGVAPGILERGAPWGGPRWRVRGTEGQGPCGGRPPPTWFRAVGGSGRWGGVHSWATAVAP